MKRSSQNNNVIILIAILLAAACIVRATHARPQSPEQEVRDVEQKLDAALATNDVPLYFSFYAPDFEVFDTDGRASLATATKNWSDFINAGNRVQKTRVWDLHIQISPSQDAAVATYRWRIEINSKDGSPVIDDMQVTDVLFRRDSSWKVVSSHYSTAPKSSTAP